MIFVTNSIAEVQSQIKKVLLKRAKNQKVSIDEMETLLIDASVWLEELQKIQFVEVSKAKLAPVSQVKKAEKAGKKFTRLY